MEQDYNVRYVMHLKKPRVLPKAYTSVLIEALNEFVLPYYNNDPDSFSQYAYLEETIKSKKKNQSIEKSRHILHSGNFTRKNKEDKIELNNKRIDKVLKEYGNKIDLWKRFETGVTIADYMGSKHVQEISIGCTAKYLHSGKNTFPSLFIEARSLTNKRETANRICEKVVGLWTDVCDRDYCMIYEELEQMIDLEK